MYSESYVENEVLHQDPVELVRLLYTKAIVKLQEASSHLAESRIPERSAAVAHASEILVELQGSIDREQGGEIGLHLAQLYDYMLTRLTEANAKQQAEPIDECRRLLETVLEGWTEAAAAQQPSQGESPEADMALAESAGHAWTL